MIRPLLQSDDPNLRQVSTAIPKHDCIKFTQLAIDMAETMLANNGIGLAAPQIGVMQRVIAVLHRRNVVIMIDPIITKCRDEFDFEGEMCLSFPGITVTRPRYKLITLHYTDTSGHSQKIKLSGLEAVCVQHEIDHLNGTVIGDN